MDVVEHIETDLIVLFLEGSDLVRLSSIHISTICLHVLHITRTVVRENPFVHDSVTISGTRLQIINDHFMDLTDRIDTVASCIIVFIPFRIIEMRTIIRSDFNPGHTINIRCPDYCKSSF